MANYYKDFLKWDDYPEWSKNRITYFDDVNKIEKMIDENKYWIEYHNNRCNYISVVAHKERVIILQKLLDELDINRQVPNFNNHEQFGS